MSWLILKKLETSIKINNLKINYKFSKSQQPTAKNILLLHGWGCDLNIYENLHANLQENFNVFSIDLPGFGKSEVPKSVWGVEEYTTLIENFVKKLEINNPIFAGHSFGGRISILYGSRNQAEKIVLIDSAGIKPKRSLKYYVKVYSYKIYKRILPIFVGRKKAEKTINKFRKKVGSSDYQNVDGMMRQILVKVVNEDLTNVLSRIKAPTLLIWGENDTATPVRDAKIMEKHIPNAGLVVLKNAGHYSFLEKQFEFNIIINNFLKS